MGEIQLETIETIETIRKILIRNIANRMRIQIRKTHYLI